jgi:hypothetical protein
MTPFQTEAKESFDVPMHPPLMPRLYTYSARVTIAGCQIKKYPKSVGFDTPSECQLISNVILFYTLAKVRNRIIPEGMDHHHA